MIPLNALLTATVSFSLAEATIAAVLSSPDGSNPSFRILRRRISHSKTQLNDSKSSSQAINSSVLTTVSGDGNKAVTNAANTSGIAVPVADHETKPDVPSATPQLQSTTSEPVVALEAQSKEVSSLNNGTFFFNNFYLFKLLLLLLLFNS